MKTIHPRGLAAILFCLATAHLGAGEDVSPKPADPAVTVDLGAVKVIPIADAIKAAVQATPGKVTKVTLAAPDGKAVYQVEIPGADGSVTTVQVDAAGGQVTGNSVVYPAKKGSEPPAKAGTPPPGGRKARGEKDDDD